MTLALQGSWSTSARLRVHRNVFKADVDDVAAVLGEPFTRPTAAELARACAETLPQPAKGYAPGLRTPALIRPPSTEITAPLM
jgi:hypothetical protein